MKKHIKTVALIVLTLSLMLSMSACLDPISIIPDLTFNVTGRIDFNDVTAGAFIITNLSKTVDVTRIEIEQPVWVLGEDLPLDGPFSSTITGRPWAGQRSASYLAPSTANYDTTVAFKVWNETNRLTEDTARSGTFLTSWTQDRDPVKWADINTYIYDALNFILLNARDAIEFFIYRDTNGDVKITHIIYRNGVPEGGSRRPILINVDANDTIDIDNIINNGNNGGGSSPALILIADGATIAPFIIVNRTLDQNIDSIVFNNSSNNNSYSIGNSNNPAVRSNNRRSIALEVGASFDVTINSNGVPNPLNLNTNIHVFSPLAQQSINNYVHFYRAHNGTYWLTHEWPPTSTPSPDDKDLLPPKDDDKTVDPSINSALLLITNLSRSTNVDSVFITQQVSGETRTVAQFTGAPRSLETKAQYLAPNPPPNSPYTVSVRIDGQEGTILNTEVVFTRARDIVELFIYQDESGKFVIVNRLNFPRPGHPPNEDDFGHPNSDDPFEGEGSMPAVIPPANRTTIGSFIIVNQTRNQDILSVEFTRAIDRVKSIMMTDAPPSQNQRSIGLGQGDWDVRVHLGGGVSVPAAERPARRVTIVPSNDPQSIREHYLYFYRNNRGEYALSTTWPPIPNDISDEDLVIPPSPHGSGLLRIINNSDAIVTSVAIFDFFNENRDPMFLDSEVRPTPFMPVGPVNPNSMGYVNVVGTSAFPITEQIYRIRVYMVSEDGERTVERLAYIRNRVVDIVISSYHTWTGCPDCIDKPCDCPPVVLPPGCDCGSQNPNCNCGTTCNCQPNQCDCGPANTCKCANCTCVGTCECTETTCKCPEIEIPGPAPSYSFSGARNTLIDTGVAIKDGRVWVWGFRGSGQQGNGNSAVLETMPPAMVNSLTGIVAVTGSAYTLVALDDQGRLWGWGQNLYGAAGVGVTENRIVSTPRQVVFPGVGSDFKIEQIDAGEYFFIARGNDGSVWTWGHNLYGQIGNNGLGDAHSPVRVNLPGGASARLVGASYEGAFAVTNSAVYAWGRNIQGGLGIPSTTTSVTHRTPQHASRLDGIVSRIAQITGGYLHGHALLNDGTVVGWGQNDHIGGSGTGRQNTPITIIGVPGAAHIGIPRVTLATGETVTQFHSRYISTIVLTSERRVFTWGTEGYNIGGAPITLQNNVRSVVERTPPTGVVTDIGGGKHHVYYMTETTTGPNAGFAIWGVGYGAGTKFREAGNRNWPGLGINLP